MTQTDRLTSSFDSILALTNGAGDVEAPSSSYDACLAFADMTTATILPRRLTVTGTDGASLSVIVKNRRIVEIAQITPDTAWTAEISLAETPCGSDDDGVGLPLARALIDVTGDHGASIDRAFLDHPLPKTTSKGYPGTALAAQIAAAWQDDQETTAFETLLSAAPGSASVRFGKETTVVTPNDSVVSDIWLAERVSEILETVTSNDSLARFYVIDGATPCAVAVVRFGIEGCLVVTSETDNFDALDAVVDQIRTTLSNPRSDAV